MNTPDAPTFRGIRYYPSAEADRQYLYWTDRPRPAVQADGSPVLDVYDAGSSVTFSTQVRWGPASDDLEALRARLAKNDEVEAGAIRLSHAPFRVDQVRLLLAEDDETETTLTTAESSGFPPYDALFNVQLNGADRDGVMQALGGGPVQLIVRYEATFQPDVAARVSVSGDVRRLLEDMDPAASRGAVHARVASAAREGALQVETAGDAPGALNAQVRAMAIDLFARRLHERLHAEEAPADTDRLAVEVDIEGQDGIAYRTETNVADWFEQLPPEGHIHPVGGGASEDDAEPDDAEAQSEASPEVRWKVSLGEAPVEKVKLQQDDVQRTIESADAAPARLPDAHAEQPLTVRTTYDAGDEPFATDVKSRDDGGWTLTASDLGLAHVVVDARERRAAGAEALRVRVQYRPTGEGERDDRTLYFRHDDWMRDWYLVTRARGLAGTLECDIVETEPDGTRTERERTLEQPTIRL